MRLLHVHLLYLDERRHVFCTHVPFFSTKGDASSTHTSCLSWRKETCADNARLPYLEERWTCVSCVMTKGDACWQCASPLSWQKEMRAVNSLLLWSTYVLISYAPNYIRSDIQIHGNPYNSHASYDKIQHHHVTSKEASLARQQYHSHSPLTWQQYHKIHGIWRNAKISKESTWNFPLAVITCSMRNVAVPSRT
jgi:hypothetical protein